MSAAASPPPSSSGGTAAGGGSGSGRSSIPGLRYELKESGQSARRLEITIPAAAFDDAVEAELRRIRRAVRMRGFRRGKAPKERIEAAYGERTASEVAWSLFDRAAGETLAELGVAPIAPPKPQGEPRVRRGEPLVLTLAFEVWPDIGEVNLSGIEVRRREVGVAEEQILETLEKIREERAPLTPVDRGARDGDLVRGDVEETNPDDASAEPVRREDVAFAVGKDPSNPALNEAFQGVRPGDTAVATLGSRPVGPGAPPGAGGRRRLAFQVKEVCERTLPPLDDELARAVGANSFLALRGDIRDRLRKAAEAEEERRFRDEVVAALLERNPVDPPRALVAESVEAEVREGMRLYEAAGTPQEDAEKQIRAMLPGIEADSKRRVATSILLDAVAEQHRIEPPRDAISARLFELAEEAKKTPAALRAAMERNGQLQQLEAVETRKAALDFVLARANPGSS